MSRAAIFSINPFGSRRQDLLSAFIRHRIGRRELSEEIARLSMKVSKAKKLRPRVG
jgi:hypothetical protein